MDILKNLTIIIPPHNRPIHLKRVLDYYKDDQLNIIITDSSELPYSYKLIENSRYYHFPNTYFVQKINKVLDKIKTKYVMLLAEDDFYPTASLEKCVKFLEENHFYDSCQGNYYNFDQNNPESLKNIYYNSFEVDLNQSNSLERVRQLHTSYFQFFYSIQRTGSFKSGFKEMYELNMKNMFAVEWYIAMNSICNGFHKVLNVNYGIRENISDSVGRSKKDFKYFATSDETKETYSATILQIAKKLEFSTNLDVSDLQIKIKNYISNHLQLVKSKKSIYDKLVRKIKKEIIKYKIKKANPMFSNEINKINSYISKHQLVD